MSLSSLTFSITLYSPNKQTLHVKLKNVNDILKRIKLGWILLLALLIYSIFITSAFQRNKRDLSNLRNASTINASTTSASMTGDTAATGNTTQNGDSTQSNETSAVSQESAVVPPVTFAEAGLWMPIVGARVPQNPMWLPSAPRNYRLGESQGFDFYSDDAGVIIAYGTPVIASDDAKVIRVDSDHTELSSEKWDELLAEVGANGANDDQLDILRGRQIWLETQNGQTLRYAHLSGIRNGIEAGQQVYRGQVIGYIGNSGTDNAVKGDARGARLHFEIWDSEGQFFGQGLDTEDVQIRSPRLFVGP